MAEQAGERAQESEGIAREAIAAAQAQVRVHQAAKEASQASQEAYQEELSSISSGGVEVETLLNTFTMAA